MHLSASEECIIGSRFAQAQSVRIFRPRLFLHCMFLLYAASVKIFVPRAAMRLCLDGHGTG